MYNSCFGILRDLYNPRAVVRVPLWCLGRTVVKHSFVSAAGQVSGVGDTLIFSRYTGWAYFFLNFIVMVCVLGVAGFRKNEYVEDMKICVDSLNK